MKAITAITIAAVLLIAGVALAATNTYTITGSASPNKAGTKKKPVAIALKTTTVTGEAAGNRPAVVKKEATKTTGIRVNGKAFPTCEASRIQAAGSDDDCPSGSLVGTSKVVVKSGLTDKAADQTFTCNIDVRLFNAKSNHVAFHLVAAPADCDGNAVNNVLDGVWTQNAKGATLTYTTPYEQSHSVAAISSATASTDTTFKKLTKKVKGKKVGYIEAIGCKGGKRTTTITFTTEDNQVGTATDSQKC